MSTLEARTYCHAGDQGQHNAGTRETACVRPGMDRRAAAHVSGRLLTCLGGDAGSMGLREEVDGWAHVLVSPTSPQQPRRSAESGQPVPRRHSRLLPWSWALL